MDNENIEGQEFQEQQPANGSRPRQSDFDDYDTYTEALIDWKAGQKIAHRASAFSPTQKPNEAPIIDEYLPERQKKAAEIKEYDNKIAAAEARGDLRGAQQARDVRRLLVREFEKIPEPSDISEERDNTVKNAEAYLKGVNAGEIDLDHGDKERTRMRKLIHDLNDALRGTTRRYLPYVEDNEWGAELDPTTPKNVAEIRFPNAETASRWDRAVELGVNPHQQLARMGLRDYIPIRKSEPVEEPKKKKREKPKGRAQIFGNGGYWGDEGEEK